MWQQLALSCLGVMALCPLCLIHSEDNLIDWVESKVEFCTNDQNHSTVSFLSGFSFYELIKIPWVLLVVKY